MFANRELLGRLSDIELVNLILKLRAINEEHIIGSSSIDYLGKTYDAQRVNRALEDLETIAKENKVQLNALTSESGVDELLGTYDTKSIEIITSLKNWNLLEQISTL